VHNVLELIFLRSAMIGLRDSVKIFREQPSMILIRA
jgi:hypothetical protein